MPETDRNPAADREVAYRPAPVVRDEHAEPTFTRLVEQQTAKIPSHWFLVGSFAAMCASLLFEISGDQQKSRFIGMWAPSLLIVGVYNKLVKALGPR
jgi:hypothetical protein